MYRYGYRYRDATNGTTRYSLRGVRRHLHKIGVPRTVKGYCVVHGPTVRHPYGINELRVSVRGTKGSLILRGLNWGYSGEGPRGLKQLLLRLGFGEYESHLHSVLRTGSRALEGQAGVKVMWNLEVPRETGD